jgi:hypothetical protein
VLQYFENPPRLTDQIIKIVPGFWQLQYMPWVKLAVLSNKPSQNVACIPDYGHELPTTLVENASPA